MPGMLDAVVVGAGPENGLTAAVELARRGYSVAVFEARDTVGGGARTEELTLRFRHDPYLRAWASIHPRSARCRWRTTAWSGCSPNCPWRTLPGRHRGRAVAFRGGGAAWLDRETHTCASSSNRSRTPGTPWRRTSCPCPLTALPRDPVTLARFGLARTAPSTWMMRRFRDDRARALFAGLVAHVMARSAASPPARSASSSR